MNVFVFQSVLDRYDLRDAIQPGTQATWYATRYQRDMHPGDTVFFWMAGGEHIRGLYGWGRISSDPYLREDWDRHGVDVTYETKFDSPILASAIREDLVLSNMLIFRAPQATNFLLSLEQATRLVEIIEQRGQTAPSIAGAGS